MFDIPFIIMSFIFGLFSIILSKSKANYNKLVKNNGERFANMVTKSLNAGGCILLVISVILFCAFVAGF